MDTGDVVRVIGTKQEVFVACVHDAVVYLCRPGGPVRRDDIELVREASEGQRLLMLHVLAGSSGTGHRPDCARLTLEAKRGSE